jgi:hypothetical protein
MEHVEVLRAMRNEHSMMGVPMELAALDAAIASLSAPKSGDWVLVPREPTPEMVQASNDISCRAEGEEHWAAMLAAAPQPPAEAQEVVCLECGQPTMPMGQVCYACSHPADDPAEAQAQGGGEVDCRCVDCGGNQPGHDPTCSYMHELHGEAQPVGHGCGDHDHADYIPGCGACAATLPEKRTAQPPSAPVGVELAALRVQEWLHAEHDLLVPVQEIEAAMRTPCSCSATEHDLAQQPAPVAPVGVERILAEMREEGQADIVDGGVVLEWEDDLRNALTAQQPAAVDGDSPYPAPRNRQEAAALAKLALAYLGVTSAHIDAAVARCETDLAAQPGGGK